MAVGNLGTSLADDRRAHHRMKNLGGAWHRMVRTNVLNIIEHSINIKALSLNPLPKGERLSENYSVANILNI